MLFTALFVSIIYLGILWCSHANTHGLAYAPAPMLVKLSFLDVVPR